MTEKLVNYQIIGDGPPLVLVHGWGVSFTIWRELAPLLRPHYKLIIPELPGIGHSPMPPAGDYYERCAEALEDLRQELNIPRWHILSYSMGGWVAVDYARRWPQAVDHLVFLCIVKPLPGGARMLAVLKAIDRAIPAFGDWMLTGPRLHWLVTLLGFNGIPGPLARLWSDEIGSQPLSIVKQTLQDLPQGGRAAYNLPDVPVRFIWGRMDGLAVAGLHAGANDVILPGGHALPMTGAASVAKAVLAFVPPGAGDGPKVP